MKLHFRPPIFYSKDSFYALIVKETDIDFPTGCLSLKDDKTVFIPDIDTSDKETLAAVIKDEISEWFAQPLQLSTLIKRLQFEFTTFNDLDREEWAQFHWSPTTLKVKSNTFILVFAVSAITRCNPRIPIDFLEPEESPSKPEVEEVRNIVIQPSGSDMVDIPDLPLAETSSSVALQFSKNEYERLDAIRRAKLKASIARLKLLELKREYSMEYGEKAESSESDLESESSVSEPE
jgi:hypothetical protein